MSCDTNPFLWQTKFFYKVTHIYLGQQGSVGLGKGFFYTDPLLPLLCYDIPYDDVIRIYKNSRNVIEKYKKGMLGALPEPELVKSLLQLSSYSAQEDKSK